ncbi:hypothetical protein cco12_01409 [Campylobacter coli 84-2]|nr:hypothetical protein cco12_01409 [Campylobacter coli 84-2]
MQPLNPTNKNQLKSINDFLIFIKLLKHQKRKNLKMQKQYPEVHSLEESLAILKKYKDDVNKEDYEGIKSVISNHAIESIYMNELDIIAMIKQSALKLSADEIIAEYKEKGFVEYVKSCHRSLQS